VVAEDSTLLEALSLFLSAWYLALSGLEHGKGLLLEVQLEEAPTQELSLVDLDLTLTKTIGR